VKPRTSRARALLCAKGALDRKAYDLVVLDVRKLSSLADFFVICTGRSDTQVQAIAQSIEDELRKIGEHPISIEGYPHGQWAVMDFADIIVHIFVEPAREFYDLERLWALAPHVKLPQSLAEQVDDLQLASHSR
jgi:ribosome-associated protein